MAESSPDTSALPGGPRARRARLWRLAWLVGGAAGAATLIGYLDRFWWVCELFVHFRLTYLAVLGAVAIAFAVGRHWRAVMLFALLAGLNLPPILPYLRDAPAPSASGRVLQAVSLNLQLSNERAEPINAFLDDTPADLVLLLEVTTGWQQRLEVLRNERFPHRHVQPRDDGFGLALLSRLPLESVELVDLGETDVPAITAQLRVGGHAIRVLGAHLNWPLGPQMSARRNRQLAGIETFVRSTRQPVIVLGDLNVSPWSFHYRRLLDGGLLNDKPAEAGLYATWPTWLLPLAIPIDHCLVTSELAILTRSTGPRVGSDHRPLLLEISVPTLTAVQP